MSAFLEQMSAFLEHLTICLIQSFESPRLSMPLQKSVDNAEIAPFLKMISTLCQSDTSNCIHMFPQK